MNNMKDQDMDMELKLYYAKRLLNAQTQHRFDQVTVEMYMDSQLDETTLCGLKQLEYDIREVRQW